MGQPSEQPICPRNGSAQAVASLRSHQAEKAGKGVGDAEQGDHDWTSRWGAGIARPSLRP